jgi:hypothetical protein
VRTFLLHLNRGFGIFAVPADHHAASLTPLYLGGYMGVDAGKLRTCGGPDASQIERGLFV